MSGNLSYVPRIFIYFIIYIVVPLFYFIQRLEEKEIPI